MSDRETLARIGESVAARQRQGCDFDVFPVEWMTAGVRAELGRRRWRVSRFNDWHALVEWDGPRPAGGPTPPKPGPWEV